jgi:hypothetical protein
MKNSFVLVEFIFFKSKFDEISPVKPMLGELACPHGYLNNLFE